VSDINYANAVHQGRGSFGLTSTVSGRGPTAIGLSAVFCSVLAVFLVILGSEAAEGASFCSQIVPGAFVR
jgi:hypothetical protein